MSRVSHRWASQTLLILFAALLLASCASGPRGLLRPNGVAVAPDGSLYVMDAGNYRVAHLSAEGRLLDTFGQLGTGLNDIYEGWDIQLDTAGNVYFCHHNYASDESFVTRDSVKVFSAGGQFLREVGGQDYATPEESENRNGPYGLDIDRQGRVYMGDYRASTVRVFDAQGQPLARFFGGSGDGPGLFSGLNDVAVDDERQLLYVLDYVYSRIQVFDLGLSDSGQLTVTYKFAFGSYGRGPGQFSYLQYMTVDDASGRLYVSDTGNRRIQVFDAAGQYLHEFAPPIDEWQAMGLDVGPDGALYAADTFNSTIWVFEPDGQLRRRIEVEP